MSDIEKVGPSGLTAKRLQELCEATGLKESRGVLFSDREMVRGVVEQLITSGELIPRDELRDKVKSLIQTVAFNMFYATVRACHNEWNAEWGGTPLDYPPMPETNTVMKDGMDGVEKNFTKG